MLSFVEIQNSWLDISSICAGKKCQMITVSLSCLSYGYPLLQSALLRRHVNTSVAIDIDVSRETGIIADAPPRSCSSVGYQLIHTLDKHAV